MFMKRIITALTVICLCLAASAAKTKTVTAESILAGLRSNIATAHSVDAVFTINTDKGPLQGSVILAGDKYQMSTPELEVWYDGKTQWTLSHSSKEVNVTTPDADERMASNPFAILTAGKGYYTARRLADSKGNYTARRLADSKGNYTVQLTPADKTSTVSSFIIYVRPADKWPAAITVNFEDGRRIEITVDRIAAGKARQASIFRYNKARYPGFEIIDLR